MSALASQAQQRRAVTSVNWPLHNLDLAGSRFSPLDQINTSNVSTLTPRWLFQHGIIDGVSNQTTPVVDSVMYVTDSRGSVYAVDAADGHWLWTDDVTNGQAGSVVTSGDLVFVGSGSNVAGYFFAFDARTGRLLWKFNTGAGVFGSPAVYMVNGEQFVTVASGGGERGRRGGDLILSVALPPR